MLFQTFFKFNFLHTLCTQIENENSIRLYDFVELLGAVQKNQEPFIKEIKYKLAHQAVWYSSQ